ncbi:MAG: histidine phosphatase family protein [Parvibaculales bacterium]|jgi:broad specificity phosphatase PhoE|nr:histidine phosphatase family protein [Alphaproteobacteria bacterium]
MTRIYMIRHGKAAAGWDGDADPGLNELGRAQAEAVAKKVQALVATPVPIYSSPLKRCQETAAPLAAAWGVTPQIEAGVGEIPPPLEDLTERTQWLRRVMAGTWEGLYRDAVSVESGVDFRGWNDNVVNTLNAFKGEAVVIFSHFIALNAAYCAATGAADVVSFAPENCSLSIFDTDGTSLSLVAQGEETEDMKIALGKRS